MAPFCSPSVARKFTEPRVGASNADVVCCVMLCHEIADKLLSGRLFGKPPCGQTIRSLILQHAQHDRAKVVKFFTDLEIAAGHGDSAGGHPPVGSMPVVPGSQTWSHSIIAQRSLRLAGQYLRRQNIPMQ